MVGLPQRYSPAELRRMTELFFPEERRHEFTTEPWDGVSFRHYRDPKIVCLEHYRPQEKRNPADRSGQFSPLMVG